MRRIVFAIFSALLIAVVSVVAPTSAVARPGELAGSWTSTDTDGSSQTLAVRGSGQGVYSVFLVDDAATSACDGAPAMFVGSGTFDGETLAVFGTLTCMPGGNVFRTRIPFEFTYSAGTDTLTDFTGVTWTRA
jgi:hypothetical protein